jgi:hypothetical protein
MAGTRALFASIGASLALVIAAALSLLAVSVVFAFGWTPVSVPESVRTQPLVFAGTMPSRPSSAGATAWTATGRPIVVAPPARRPARSGASRPDAAGSSAVRAPERPATSRATSAPRSTPQLTPPATHSVGGPKRSPAAVARPSTGEGVRKVGEDLSSKVKGTGAAIAQVTQPLAPPVSTAVQTVFNAVAELLSRTTGVIAGAVDKLLPPKK